MVESNGSGWLFQGRSNAVFQTGHPQHSRLSVWRQTARGNATEANLSLIEGRHLPLQLCNRTRGVEDLQTQSYDPLQLGINSAATHTAPVGAELMHKHSLCYTGCCAQEDRLLQPQNARRKSRWWSLRGWKISILLPLQTHAPPTPARMVVRVKTEEVTSAVAAPSHTVGQHVKKVMALLQTYTPYFGS